MHVSRRDPFTKPHWSLTAGLHFDPYSSWHASVSCSPHVHIHRGYQAGRSVRGHQGEGKSDWMVKHKQAAFGSFFR
ncbi:Ubiquitin carboxyl-terminal hydrolase 34 [Fusarium oxysporum f. sp. albedinis]|nr:Ubiquitin carboxyl-terminal hydrolase 34 [Fusarium oxysporum f. sp. albedinis]